MPIYLLVGKRIFKNIHGRRDLFLKGVQMIQSVGITTQDAATLMRERSRQIYEKLKSGETEEAIVTGGNAFTETVWNKMLQSVDDYLDQVKEDQQIRFERMDKEKEEVEFQLEKQEKKEQEEISLEKRLFERSALQERVFSAGILKEMLTERSGASLNVPYGYLAKDGIINYDNLKLIKKDENWLYKKLKENKVESHKDVFLFVFDNRGPYIVLKEFQNK